MRKQFTPQQKATVVLAALANDKTVNQVATTHQVHPTQVKQWTQTAKAGLAQLFSDKRNKTSVSHQQQIDELHRVIGLRDAELEWLKKRLSLPAAERRKLVEPSHPIIPVVRQCELLGVSRSSLYYQPVINPERLALDKLHMDAIDEIYTRYPFYGSRRMVVELHHEYDINICRDRVRHLMQQLGLEAIYPKPNTSKAAPMNEKYPYLLKGLDIVRPNQVFGSDITYIKTAEGFVYLVAFIDWFSRYVVAWRLSDSMETDFCLEALDAALGIGVPEISNTDQGSQFTAGAFIDKLKAKDVRVSMDGRGRCMDNIFTERLWRTVKYEDVYLKSYRNIDEARIGLSRLL